jgi:phage terminase large subunit-like protein
VTDEPIEGPDPNAIRRHQKKMLTEFEYRRKYRRFDFYKPNSRQLAFHGLLASECMLRAGNQLGKTHAAAAQMTMDALALYPEWYIAEGGRQFIVPPKIERPFDFLGWAACDTSATTRAGVQTKLLGDIMQDGGLGTGLIPLDNIVGKPAMARGISDFVDSVTLRRENGGTAVIRFKTYEQGRKAFQGEPVDEMWVDEDPGDDEVYGECLARLTTTRGKIIISMTPMLGLSPVRKRFKQRTEGTAEVLMTIDDCAVSRGGHIPDEDIPGIVARYKEHQRQARAYGADMQGEGAVFETPAERLKHTRDPATFPPYWPWLWGLDFRHSGSLTGGHPFAAVLGCWDRDNDIIYIVHAVRLLGQAPMHVAAIKASPMWDAPVAWPHDGGRAASLLSGETVAKVYKKLGLNMRPACATFPDGSFKFENGIDEMDRRFATGRLKVAAHLSEWFDEYQGYHRKDGLVVKVDDDLMSATRQLVMDIRYGKTVGNDATGRFGRAPEGSPNSQAKDVDFDVFGAFGEDAA